MELTSATTRTEDLEDKFQLYQDTLRVPEYFLFDPLGDYLQPRLQGYRLRRGKYSRIKAIKGRLASQVLGLQMEPQGRQLRLVNPKTGESLLTPQEEVDRLRRELAQLRGEKRE
jgi:Uma2 family endonuclease